MPSNSISYYWVYFGYFLYSGCLFIFFIASTRGSGVINKRNYKNLLSKYPYDEINYFPKNCETCNIPKYNNIT